MVLGTFQSSPALLGRCNLAAGEAYNEEHGFQSSPALSGRCNLRPEDRGRELNLEVSILTGPFGPVQPKTHYEAQGML